MVVSWPSTEAPRSRRNNEGQTHLGASSAASHPRSVCVWRVFSECGVFLFALHFPVIFSAAEIPRGQNQEHNRWAKVPVLLHVTVLGRHRTQSSNFGSSRHSWAQKPWEKWGSTVQQGEGTGPLLPLYVYRTRPFPPHHGSCPLSLDISPFPRGDFCTDERKWVPCRESTSMSHGLSLYDIV